MSSLDGLLNDLESACQSTERALNDANAHLDARTTTSDRSRGLNQPLNLQPPPVPVRDKSSKLVMAATTSLNNPVANNINELDSLLQDLSNAR